MNRKNVMNSRLSNFCHNCYSPFSVSFRYSNANHSPSLADRPIILFLISDRHSQPRTQHSLGKDRFHVILKVIECQHEKILFKINLFSGDFSFLFDLRARYISFSFCGYVRCKWIFIYFSFCGCARCVRRYFSFVRARAGKNSLPLIFSSCLRIYRNRVKMDITAQEKAPNDIRRTPKEKPWQKGRRVTTLKKISSKSIRD